MYGVEISDEAFSLYDFDASGIVKYDLNEGLPNFGERFDAIIAAHIIHHLEAPERYLAAVRRALAPGGVLVAAIPNIIYYRYRLGFLAGKFPPISLAHRNFQTPLEFEAMVTGSGFDVVSRTSAKRTLGGRFFPTFFSQDIVYVLRPASGSAASASTSSGGPGSGGPGAAGK
jgi:SAM-dependent methyltransferase